MVNKKVIQSEDIYTVLVKKKYIFIPLVVVLGAWLLSIVILFNVSFNTLTALAYLIDERTYTIIKSFQYLPFIYTFGFSLIYTLTVYMFTVYILEEGNKTNEEK